MTSRTFASVAGTRAAEALRKPSFDGRVLMGSEPARRCETFYGVQASQLDTGIDTDTSKLETGDMSDVTTDGSLGLLARTGAILPKDQG